MVTTCLLEPGTVPSWRCATRTRPSAAVLMLAMSSTQEPPAVSAMVSESVNEAAAVNPWNPLSSDRMRCAAAGENAPDVTVSTSGGLVTLTVPRSVTVIAITPWSLLR